MAKEYVCPHCWAHMPESYQERHRCDGLMKLLVEYHKNEKLYRNTILEDSQVDNP